MWLWLIVPILDICGLVPTTVHAQDNELLTFEVTLTNGHLAKFCHCLTHWSQRTIFSKDIPPLWTSEFHHYFKKATENRITIIQTSKVRPLCFAFLQNYNNMWWQSSFARPNSYAPLLPPTALRVKGAISHGKFDISTNGLESKRIGDVVSCLLCLRITDMRCTPSCHHHLETLLAIPSTKTKLFFTQCRISKLQLKTLYSYQIPD